MHRFWLLFSLAVLPISGIAADVQRLLDDTQLRPADFVPEPQRIEGINDSWMEHTLRTIAEGRFTPATKVIVAYSSATRVICTRGCLHYAPEATQANWHVFLADPGAREVKLQFVCRTVLIGGNASLDLQRGDASGTGQGPITDFFNLARGELFHLGAGTMLRLARQLEHTAIGNAVPALPAQVLSRQDHREPPRAINLDMNLPSYAATLNAAISEGGALVEQRDREEALTGATRALGHLNVLAELARNPPAAEATRTLVASRAQLLGRRFLFLAAWRMFRTYEPRLALEVQVQQAAVERNERLLEDLRTALRNSDTLAGEQLERLIAQAGERGTTASSSREALVRALTSAEGAVRTHVERSRTSLSATCAALRSLQYSEEIPKLGALRSTREVLDLCR